MIKVYKETDMSEVLHVKDQVIEDLGHGAKRRILAYSKKIMPVKINFEKGAIGAEHQHEHEQITYVISGKFAFTVDGKKEIVSAGDAIHFSPNSVHGALCLEKGELIDCFTPYREDFIKK